MRIIFPLVLLGVCVVVAWVAGEVAWQRAVEAWWKCRASERKDKEKTR